MSKNPSTGNITHVGITGTMIGAIGGRILHTRIGIVPLPIIGDRNPARRIPDTQQVSMPPPQSALQAEHHCWLSHNLYDPIRVDLKVTYQYCVDVEP